MAEKHYKLLISGKVQGVWFRASTRDQAEKLGLRGTVRNLPDGSVYLEMEGPEEALEAMLHWCWEGPPLAEVENIRIERTTPEGHDSFRILR